ncbi:MAG: tyrosine-type recombinase/integrase, partial [Boseongicola sp.]|nr:tyrosine-type recombinase/integrase [Boseongicola sp.]
RTSPSHKSSGIDRIPVRNSGDAQRGDEPLTIGDLYSFWIKARDAVGIVADARLHDLRHAHASHAVMNGESLHVAGRLLGHRRASTTNRYVHLDDATLSQAAERVAETIRQKLNYRQQHPSVRQIGEFSFGKR